MIAERSGQPKGMRVGTAGRAGHLADDPASSMVVTRTCPLVLARIGYQPEVLKPAESQKSAFQLGHDVTVDAMGEPNV
jgi:hypothetical protein